MVCEMVAVVVRMNEPAPAATNDDVARKRVDAARVQAVVVAHFAKHCDGVKDRAFCQIPRSDEYARVAGPGDPREQGPYRYPRYEQHQTPLHADVSIDQVTE